MNQDLEQIWAHIQAELRMAVDDITYCTWLESLRAVDLHERTLTLAAPVGAFDWVNDRFGRLLQACSASVLGPDILVSITADGAARANHTPATKSRGERSGGHNEKASTHEQRKLALNPKLTFDQFVIGDCNRLAHAASLAVAEMPGQAYNPLFICGPPGVGKTHLLHSIGSLLLEHNPSLSVCSTTGEAFTSEFVAAVADGGMGGFKNSFRCCDVLLVDDVQFLERKARTEEEFFHTFNALYDAGSQIVLTSDRPPKDLQALEDRLRERFQAGLVADISPPDLPTRITILHKRAHDDGIDLRDGGVLPLLASHITSNVRTLEGALIRVVAFSSLTGRPITTELAEEVLAGLYPSSGGGPQPITIGDIQASVCAQFDVSQDALLSAARTARVSWPRQVAMYLARELTDHSLPAIGRQFGGRDHTTVLHACKRADARISTDPAARSIVDKLRAQLNVVVHDRSA